MSETERNINIEPISPEVLESIRASDLHDLEYSRNPYTWTSNNHGTGKTKYTLDRILLIVHGLFLI